MTLHRLSIRARIQLWHGVLLACILIALSVAAWKLRWDSEVRRIDRELTEMVATMHSSLRGMRQNDGHPPPRNSAQSGPENFEMPADHASRLKVRNAYWAAWSRSGRAINQSANFPGTVTLPAQESRSALGKQILRWSPDDVREGYLFTPPGECLFIGLPTVTERAELRIFGWWLFAMTAGVLVAGLWMDAWIVRKAIQPAEEIISAAERITQGDLSTRIPSGRASPELDRLTGVLNQTFASLDRAFTQQSRFSADVAHELRTPVTVLIAESQVALERERSAEDYRETISACLRSAHRMGGLIESLLELAQVASADATTRTPCDLAQCVREVIDGLRSTAEAQGVEIRLSLEPALCVASFDQISQVAANLTINAIQHNHPGGHVTIETCVRDDKATLRVANTGPGIPPADLPHVFERFYRVDASRSRKTGGVGLGLAICKAIADSHGAHLTAETTPEGLTVFGLRLPAGKASASAISFKAEATTRA